MNKEKYDKIFQEEVKRTGLKGIAWRFTYAKPFAVAGYRPDLKLISVVINKDGSYPTIEPFRRAIRHELYHAKGGHSDIMATLCEYFPRILNERR